VYLLTNIKALNEHLYIKDNIINKFFEILQILKVFDKPCEEIRSVLEYILAKRRYNRIVQLRLLARIQTHRHKVCIFNQLQILLLNFKHLAHITSKSQQILTNVVNCRWDLVQIKYLFLLLH